MLGDSTAAQLLLHACEAYSVRPKSFIPVDQSTARALNFSVRKYGHRLRSLDNHACKLPGNFVLGSFSHYGATGPPYWVFAYPLAPWLQNTTLGMARYDMPKFKEITPGRADPTVVVASSGFWDIASWWAHEGNFSRRWRFTDNHTRTYVTGVRRLVREARRTFPRSLVVWRLMHPGAKHSITPRIVHTLNGAIRASAPSWRLPLIDGEAMVSSLSHTAQPSLGRGPPYGTLDGRHLHGFVNLALLNLLLNVVERARAGTGIPYGWTHRSNRTALGAAANRTAFERGARREERREARAAEKADKPVAATAAKLKRTMVVRDTR